MQAISPNDYKGIDVSNWQGTINFKKVKDSGVQIVYTKATEGTYYTDPFFKTNYTEGKSQGLKMGFYHFFNPENESSTIAQANYFVNAIGNLKPDCRLALDFEKTNNLDKKTLSNLAKVFFREVKRLSGVDVVLYTYTNFALNNFTEELSIYPLWIAEYGVVKPSLNSIWSSWVGFQYSSSGSIPGINGNVDLNSFTNGILLDSSIVIPDIPTPTPPPTLIYYVVKAGDTLSEIAVKFNTTLSELVKLNNITNPNLIYPGQNLLIPSTVTSYRSYTVRSGDTLSEIAVKFGVTTESLARLNNISNPNLIYPGQILKIPTSTSISNYYTVKPGDTLSQIAIDLGVTMGNLIKLNNISDPNRIYPGQVLKI